MTQNKNCIFSHEFLFCKMKNISRGCQFLFLEEKKDFLKTKFFIIFFSF